MKATIERANVTPTPVKTKTANNETSSERPSLRNLLTDICVDASRNSLQYVLRSDTAHDGE